MLLVYLITKEHRNGSQILIQENEISEFLLILTITTKGDNFCKIVKSMQLRNMQVACSEFAIA